jgi:hypothetical protein
MHGGYGIDVLFVPSSSKCLLANKVIIIMQRQIYDGAFIFIYNGITRNGNDSIQKFMQF